MRIAVPVPAFVGVTDLYKRPELKKPTPVRSVNLVNIQAESSFSQRTDAADAGMAVCVARNASIARSKRVLVKWTKRPTLDLAVEVWRDGPLSHDYL